MQYDNWNDVINFASLPIMASSTSLVLQNTDGTQTRIAGTGLTYVSGALAAGTITNVDRFDPATNGVLTAYSGTTFSAADMLTFNSNAQAAGNSIANSLPLLGGSSGNNFTITPTMYEEIGNNGRKFQIIGTNLSVNGTPDFSNGVVTEIRVVNAAGNTLQTSGPVNYTLAEISTGYTGFGVANEGTILGSYIFSQSSDVFVSSAYDIVSGLGYESYFGGSRNYQIDAPTSVYLDYYSTIGGINADFAAGTLTRGAFTDTFTISSNANVQVSGSEAADVVILGGSVTDFYGNGGNDSVFGSAGNDFITGDDGNDILRGLAGGDTIFGGVGNDRVYDHSGDDFVVLGDGNDFVQVGGGVDTYYGEGGDDYISYLYSPNGVTLDLQANTASRSWAADDTINSFESASGSLTGNDRIFGTDGNNVIRTYGGRDGVYDRAGNDTVDLGNGNDFLVVGDGVDNFDGGNGTDYISYLFSIGGVTLDLAINSASGGWAADDSIANFEGATGSRTGDDQLYGTDGVTVFRSFGGNDALYGRGGNDKLYSGNGDDFLDGGNGDDLLSGGNGVDTFHFASSGGNDRIVDFEDNLDTIEFANFSGVNNTVNAMSLASQQGTDVLFDFGLDGTLLVENTLVNQLANDIQII